MPQKKDAFYFTHDSNARNDVKILRLRKELKAEGYAIYFMLIEVLREQKDHQVALTAIPELSFDFRMSEEKILRVINDFDLFKKTTDNIYFFSDRLNRSLEEFQEFKKRRSEAGKKGMQKRWHSDDPPDGPVVKKMVL